MNSLNSRQSAILKYLLAHPDPVSAETLGTTLGISARIVRHNLAFINSWLEQFQVNIQSKPNFGLLLACNEDTRKSILEKLSQNDSDRIFSLKDRGQILLYQVLSQAGDFSESRVRAKLKISRTTLTKDWDRVEHWLNQRDLFLTHRPRSGISVQGRENDIRHALITLLFEIGLESDLINMALWGIKDLGLKQKEVSQAIQYILADITSWKLTDGWNMITWVENELVTTFADGDHLALTLYWVIMLQRINKKHFIQLSDERIHYLSTRPEYQVVQEIIDRLVIKAGLKLPPPEIAQLTLEVMTARGIFTSQAEAQNVEKNNEKTAEIARQLVHKIGQYLGTDLDNSEVITRLTDHLSRVVIRMKFELPIQNNLTEETRHAYPLIWQATSKAIDEVWDEAGPPLPAEEIAFITMYMALAVQLNKNVQHRRQNPRAVVACPSGGITVWMLVSRLQEELPEIEIKEVISLRDISKINPDDVDIIISTAQVNSRKIKPITVNPLLTEQDILKIRRELDFFEGKRN
jgi:transcriptional antiterminator